MRFSLHVSLLVPLALIALCSACGGGTTPSLSFGGDTVTAPGDSAGSEDSGGACVPKCGSKQCGDSGCPGYSCGYCGAGMYCDELFQCGIGTCTPGKGKCVEGGLSVCAEDGLSWLAPVACLPGEVCQDNACVDVSQACELGDTRCFDGGVQECNDKGAWGLAAPCPESKVCADGQCVTEGTKICEPGATRCSGGTAVETCDPEGTAWSNPTSCPAGASCLDGVCVAGQKVCDDVLQCMLQGNCGDFGANCFADCFEGVAADVGGQAMALYECIFGYCEKWGPNEPCFQTQQITGCATEFASCKDTQPCQPKCAGKECGGDGCGGLCGTCSDGKTCQAGTCVGGGGCNGVKFEGCCNGNILTWCENGSLKEQDCSWDPQCGWNSQKGFYDCDTQGGASPNPNLPKNCNGTCSANCVGKQCGDDGCGGSCGLCPEGQNCQNGICSGGCVPSCLNKQCGDNGCGGSCGACPEGSACENFMCQGDGKGCANVAMCALGCNFDESCLNTCWNKGDSQAKQLFQNLLSCVGQVCGMWVSEECLWDAIEGPCAQAYQTCMND